MTQPFTIDYPRISRIAALKAEIEAGCARRKVHRESERAMKQGASLRDRTGGLRPEPLAASQPKALIPSARGGA